MPVAAALSWLATSACVGWSGGGPTALRDEVEVLRPTQAGTYRMVGTERDSRTGELRRVVETYTVDPHFTRAGSAHQLTELRDTGGAARTWETAFRPGGAFRLRETADGASWDWDPPLRTTAAPLRVGTVWRASSTARFPDLAGTRRTSRVGARSEVVDTATIDVGGRSLFTLVVDSRVRTTVTDTDRVTRRVATFVTTVAVRTWFSPRHMRVVRSAGTTTVKGRDGGYTLTRRVEVDDL